MAARAARLAALAQALAAAGVELPEGAGVRPPVDAAHEGVGGDEACPEQLSTEVFSTYVCRTLTRGIDHPGDICEAASLCAIALPPSDYPLFDALPARLVDEGLLSKLQLEGIQYACTKHCEFLPDGRTRAGFFIGDGAGVGKGRQIAGIILDNFARGRRQHVWLSTSTDLVKDAERDLRDLGVFLKVIDGPQSLDKETKALGLAKDFKEGVLFCTYSSLTSNPKKGSRLEQIMEWCGGPEAFEGAIILDESHRAKNFTPGKEAASTKVATAVIALQAALPRARVVYCSATGVSEIGNMAYMSRMGFWGAGSAFANAEEFLGSMKQRGLGFLEMLAMEMKAEGKYVSRSLSFANAEFTSVECELEPSQVACYDAAAALWTRLRGELASALAATRAPDADAWKVFWATMQRFFKLLCVSMKLPCVLAQVRAALAAGQCVVIGLQSTGEAATSAMELTPGEATPFVSVTREMLSRFIREHFPVHINPEGGVGAGAAAADEASEEPDAATAAAAAAAAADKGKGKAAAKSAAEKKLAAAAELARRAALPVCPECAAAKAALLDAVAELDLPDNPVDALVDELGGPSRVAEMTGRKGRIVRGANGRTAFQLRASPLSAEMDGLNIQEKDAFMKGTKLVAIISDAASTGISLHADARVANTRRRVHLTVELPWSADKAIQQLGRTHRSNEVQPPLYKLVTTPLGGERRFAAAVARRLQSLGALTRGDRRAASGLDLSESNLDSAVGRKALRRLCDALSDGGAALPAGVALADILTDASRPEEATQLTTPAALHERLRACTQALGLGVPGAGAADAASLPEGGAGGEKPASASDKSDVRRFLNRLLGMPVAAQNLLFRYFLATLAAELRAAKAEGKFSEGVSDLRASSIKPDGDAQVLYQGPHTTLATAATPLSLDRGVAFDDAVALLEATGRAPAAAAAVALPPPPAPADDDDDDADAAAAAPSAAVSPVAAPPLPPTQRRADSCPDGFYKSRRELYGRDMYILAIRRPGQRHLFGVTRPNTGASFFEFDREELRGKYCHVADLAAARAGWEALHAATLRHCMHGQHCERGADCTVGRRLTRVTILSGSVVPIWSTLESVLKRHEQTLTKSDRAMRAVRVELPNGVVLVGIRYPEKQLTEVVDTLLKQAAPAAAPAAPGRRVEPPRPVDAKALAKAVTKPRTIQDFFAKGSAAPPAAPVAPAGGAGGAKRPAAAAEAAPGKKGRLSGGKAGGGMDKFMVGPYAFPAAAAGGAAGGAAAPQGRSRACPICQRPLHGSNAEDNAHIDACIAASECVVIDE